MEKKRSIVFDRVRQAFMAARKSKRGLQNEIALKTGIPKNTLSHFAHGQQKGMMADYFYKLCDALGLDPQTGLPKSPESFSDSIRVKILNDEEGTIPIQAGSITEEIMENLGEVEIRRSEYRLILELREGKKDPEARKLREAIVTSSLVQDAKMAIFRILEGKYVQAAQLLLGLAESPKKKRT
jgi:transcriptional regulator with XRE-family HTH domain